MPTYLYKARDAAGRRVKGTMDAPSKDALAGKLHNLGYLATEVVEALPGLRLEGLLDRFKRIATEDLILFNVQLSNMINAGIPLLTALNTLSRQIEHRRLKEAVGNVARNVEAGESFSEALSKHLRIFSKLFVSMVRAGEASGRLDRILARFAQFIEQQAELKQKVRSALFYPTILLAAGIGVTLYIVTAVIPQFVEIFVKTGIPLPLPTVILYRVGTALKRFWDLLILGGLALWLGTGYYASTEGGRFRVDRIKLGLPLFGTLFRKAAISRFARTLGTLVASGVPLLQSLDIVREVIGNEVLARIIGSTRTAVEKGEPISESIRVSEEFPPDVVQMIAVGEETGKLDEMLNKVSDFYDISLGYTVKRLTTLLEPILLVIMGCLIGFIMASLLLPMLDMIKILRR